MVKYLLDTDVLSALRGPDRHAAPALWLESQRESDLYLSVMTLGEVERGIARQLPRDPGFARELARWAERIQTWFADRILPVDVATARRWGRLSASLGNENADLLIAATAMEHGLTVATRNVQVFEPTGVPVFNPFGNETVG